MGGENISLFFLLFLVFLCSQGGEGEVVSVGEIKEYCLLHLNEVGSVITIHDGMLKTSDDQDFYFNMCSPTISSLPKAAQLSGNRTIDAVTQHPSPGSWVTCGKHPASVRRISPKYVHLIYTGSEGCDYTTRYSLFTLECSATASPPIMREDEPCLYSFHFRGPLYCRGHSKGLGNGNCLLPQGDRWANLNGYSITAQVGRWSLTFSPCKPLDDSFPEKCRGALSCSISDKNEVINHGREIKWENGKAFIQGGEECGDGKKRQAVFHLRCDADSTEKVKTIKKTKCEETSYIYSPHFCAPKATKLELVPLDYP